MSAYINLPPAPPAGVLLEVWYYSEWVAAVWTGREWRDEQGRYLPGVIWWRATCPTGENDKSIPAQP